MKVYLVIFDSRARAPTGGAPYSGSVLLDVRRIAMRFGSKTHAQMSSRMTRLQGLRWIKGIAIRFSISPLAVENELDRPPQMSTNGEGAGIFIGDSMIHRL